VFPVLFFTGVSGADPVQESVSDVGFRVIGLTPASACFAGGGATTLKPGR
jgi:hypothetical protein